MNRHDDALRVANELLTDLELKELKGFEIFSKAGRLARLVGRDDDPLTFLNYEREGCPAGGAADGWIGRTVSGERRTARLHFSCQSARENCL